MASPEWEMGVLSGLSSQTPAPVGVLPNLFKKSETYDALERCDEK